MFSGIKLWRHSWRLKSRDFHIRLSTIDAVAKISDKRSAHFLLQYLSDSDPQLRRKIVEVLGEMLGKCNDLSSVNILVRSLSDTDLFVRCETVKALKALSWEPKTSAQQDLLLEIEVGEEILMFCREHNASYHSLDNYHVTLDRVIECRKARLDYTLIYHPEISHEEEHWEYPNGYIPGPYDGGTPPSGYGLNYHPNPPDPVLNTETVVDRAAFVEVVSVLRDEIEESR